LKEREVVCLFRFPARLSDTIDIGIVDEFFSDLLGCINGMIFFSGVTTSFFAKFVSSPLFFLELFHTLGKERLFISFVKGKGFTESIAILYHRFFFQKISGPPSIE